MEANGLKPDIGILLLDPQKVIDPVLGTVMAHDSIPLRLIRAADVDAALEAVVFSNPDLCLVHDTGSGDLARDFLTQLRTAGLNHTCVVFLNDPAPNSERMLTEDGALLAVPWTNCQTDLIRLALRSSARTKAVYENLRHSNDEILHQLHESQDSRERMEALSAEYIGMAEQLAVAKDELEKLNQEKNKFFSVIAHDLKSPFTSLLGFSDLLRQSASMLPPDKVQSYADDIYESGQRVFTLLENLLEWARVQMGRVEFTPAEMNVRDVAERTVAVLGPVARDKDIVLTNDIPPLTAHGDAYMIDAVIRNLVNNAIKFTDHGGRITLTAEAVEDGFVRIAISDTGVGMTPEKARTLFSLGGNTSTDGTDGETGTGIGLLLCAEFVTRHGGMIDVDSTPGKGTTFYFTVPTQSHA